MGSSGTLNPEQLAQDGFMAIDQLCDYAFVRQLADVSRQRARVVKAALGDRPIGIGSAAGYLEIVQRSPGRWDVPITPKQFNVDENELPWSPFIREVLGDDAEHSFSGVVFSDPGTPAQCWHIDSPHLAADHLAPHAMNVLVALHDIPLEMGPTQCIPGSHTLTNHLRYPRLDREKLIYQNADTTPESLAAETASTLRKPWARALRAGSCLLFDDRIMHRGLANGSDRVRHVAYFSYRKKGYTENTHFESQRSLLHPRKLSGVQ